MVMNRAKHMKILRHLVIWILFYLLFLLAFFNTIPPLSAIARTSAAVGTFFLTFYASGWLVRNFWLKQRSPWFFVLSALILIVAAVLRVLFEQFPIESPVPEHLKRNDTRVIAFFTISNLVVMIFSFFTVTNQYRSAEQKRLEEIISQQKDSQLEYLKAQINPHFLFNTLNNIYSMTMVDPSKSADMTLKLSGLLRYAVYKSANQKVKVNDEVEQIKNLIGLSHLKSEQPLNIRFNTNIQSFDSIEPMLLLPLVENCLKHCNFDDTEKSFVDIELTVTNTSLHMRTHNTKSPQQQNREPESHGVGLKNLRQRLELLYKNHYSFQVIEKAHTFTTELRIQWPGKTT